MHSQTTHTILMVSPDSFQFNIQTAMTNSFQQQVACSDVNTLVKNEFEKMVEKLQANDIHVITIPSPKDHIVPDAVFPNNWFSMHKLENGNVNIILYPMLAENRRLERQLNALVDILNKNNITINEVIDLTGHEKDNKALEGTGSLVLDRVNRIVFAAISPRTHPDVLAHFVKETGYQPVVFHGHDKYQKPIYHTNVIMSIGTSFAVVCKDVIVEDEYANVVDALRKCHKDILEISMEQMENMAGNILEVKAIDKSPKIILSTTAFNTFTHEQHKQLSQYGDFVTVNIETIEKLGGGSARCMMAEIFA